MDRAIRAMFDKSLKPNRAHHLLISDSKHLYYRDSDEVICHQKKELDPRTCGHRKMLTRTIVIDEDTGLFYGEMNPREDEIDLVGFLARAWAAKTDHPMRGFPSTLYAPSSVLKNEQLKGDLAWLSKQGGFAIHPAPSGFGPSAVAARGYESSVVSMGVHAGKAVLRVLDMAAHLISLVGSGKASYGFKEAWQATAPIDAATMRLIDGLYKTPGSWRSGDFSFVLSPEQVEVLPAGNG